LRSVNMVDAIGLKLDLGNHAKNSKNGQKNRGSGCEMLEITRVTQDELRGLLRADEIELWKKLDHGVNEDRLIITKEGLRIPLKITRGKSSTRFRLFYEGYQKLSHEEARECTEVHTHPPMTGELMSWVDPITVDTFSDIDLEAIAKRDWLFPHKTLLPPGRIHRVIAKDYIYTMERIGAHWPRAFSSASYDIDGRYVAIRERLFSRTDIDKNTMLENQSETSMLIEAQATWNFLTELAHANKINMIVWKVVQ